MKINTSFLIAFFFLFSCNLDAQNETIYNDDPQQRLPIGVEKPRHHFISATGKKIDKARIEPPFWWTDLKNPSLEILLYDQDIGGCDVSIKNDLGIKLKKVERVQNPNYLFLQMEIGPGAKAGTFTIELAKAGDTKTYSYELKKRNKNPNRIQGLSSSDFIYLLMPDRFANGDYSNDSVDGMTQTGINREKVFFRHGGDIQGVMNHLDYLKELGITTLWLNPVLENDQPYESYHGYAITDHYHIDRRLGSNEIYVQFVKKCHDLGLKVIMDIVPNHVGSEHWFIKDLPSEDWIHQWKDFTKPIYRSSLIMDPHAAKSDRQRLTDGWFDNHMPDLNQKNPHLANYLIQSYIWWLEYSGQDSYRVDTYFYSDPEFMSHFAGRLEEEYPQLGMFGETWVQATALQAFFTQNNGLVEGYNAHLPGVTDFQMHFALEEALNQAQSWNGGITKVYYTLAQDFLYEKPSRNVLFLDNHDTSRFLSTVGEDENKFKSGIAFLLTMRGIPSLYYGTELLFTGFSNPDGLVRQDFPGGWKSDSVNKFKTSGRTVKEQAAFDYIKKLATYRKNTPALQVGKLTQFVPENGIYVFFRYDDETTVMVLMNTNNQAATISTKRFEERMLGFSKAKNVATDSVLTDLTEINIERNSTLVLELQN